MTAKEFVQAYIETQVDENGNQYYETIDDLFNEIGFDYDYKEIETESRWWYNLFCVQKIADRLIGYDWAESTGDDHIFDQGWDFDPNSLCFVEKGTKMIETYIKLKEVE